MNTYTKEEIKKMAEDNVKIPTSEIEKDIADTRREILELGRELQGYKMMRHNRMAMIKVRSIPSGIKERAEFIKSLQAILKYRKEVAKND